MLGRKQEINLQVSQILDSALIALSFWICHSLRYHNPNGWDCKPAGSPIAAGESSMWGDYHAMELAVYLQRLIEGGPYLTFWV